jgi:hypothetical protein
VYVECIPNDARHLPKLRPVSLPSATFSLHPNRRPGYLVDGLQCKHCATFLSTNKKAITGHGNKVHNLKRVVDDDLFNHVRL